MTESTGRIRSLQLGNERTVWVREPQDPARADQLTIFLDGEFYRERVGAGAVLDDLRGGLADSWFVFVSTESAEARWRECPCHPPFARFIVGELLPWLEERHPAIGGVRRRVLAGLSYTGLAAAFVAKEFPGVFGRVISQSGSFWFDDCRLERDFRAASVRLPTAFHLSVGTREVQRHVQHRADVLQVVSQIEGVQRFRDVLLQLGHAVTYAEFDGGHDFDAWRRELPDALRWALAD